jgi:hypothetical protein
LKEHTGAGSWLGERSARLSSRSLLIGGAKENTPFPPPEATKTCSLATRLANLLTWSFKAALKLLQVAQMIRRGRRSAANIRSL